MLDTIVLGARRTLNFARRCGAVNFLLTSSGAVYGRQPPGVSHLPEDYPGAPDVTRPVSAYGEGKRLAEMLCALYARETELKPKIARCFAFVGPYLRLDIHFAIGNFIRDGLRGGPVQVEGDGSPYRSYLYTADLAIWLWTILGKGEASRPYNVGSEEAIRIADLAGRVANQFSPRLDVRIGQAQAVGVAAHRYIPSVKRAREELGLRQWIPLDAAIQKTIRWNRCRLATGLSISHA
jgi:dTDP-glucose 4,6-dehydratase